MGNCLSGNLPGGKEREPLIKQIGGHKKDEGGGLFEEDIEGEAWTDVPKRSCVILPGSTYECPWDVIFWRLALLAAAVFIMAWSIHDHMLGINDDNPNKTIKNTEIKYWFIYLTHWGLVTEVLYFFFALVTLLSAVASQEPERKRMENSKPWYMSITFALQSTMLVFSFLIAALYWVLVYDKKEGRPQAISVATHGGNFVLMLLDFILGQQPMFFMKIWWPIMYAGAYATFSYVYYRNGGVTEDGHKNIYEAIDWNDPRGVATMYGMILSSIIVVWCVFYGLYRFIKAFCGPPPLKG